MYRITSKCNIEVFSIGDDHRMQGMKGILEIIPLGPGFPKMVRINPQGSLELSIMVVTVICSPIS